MAHCTDSTSRPEGVGLWAICLALRALGGPPEWSAFPMFAAAFGVIVSVTARFGLLAMVMFQFTYLVAGFYPLTSDLSTWYAGPGADALLVCAGLALYGSHTSPAGQPLLRGRFLDD